MAYCKQCGKEVGSSETFCRHCGARISSLTGPRGALSGADAGEQDLAVFIGKNAATYLAAFRKFNQNGSDSFTATWHWPAFFLNFWWLLYRKLYVWALVPLLLGCIPYVGLFTSIAFGVSANYIYYRHAKKKLLEVKAQPGSDAERTAALARAGGVNSMVVVAAPLLAVAVLGILAAIAIPQFAAYRQRAYDVTAKHEVQDACARGARVFAEHPEKTELEPDDLLHAGLVRTPDVNLMLLDGRRASFGVSGSHTKGTKVYSTDRECRLTEEVKEPAARQGGNDGTV